MKKNDVTARNLAVDILERVERNQSFSNLLLSDAVNAHSLSSEDRAFLTELVYGVIQNKRLLDFQLEPFLKKQKKIDNWVLQLLRISLYQMTLLDKIPMHAIVNEAVNIGKNRGHKGISGFVNGVLRNIDRQGVRTVENIENPIEKLAITYSYPDWIVQLLNDEVGFEETEEILDSLSSKAKVSLRINTNAMSREDVMDHLEEEDGFVTHKSIIAKDGIISENGLPLQSKLFTEGIITVQDESSMLVAEAMQIEKSDKILDACASPGGKTTHMANYLDSDEGGHILALDLHKNKLKKVTDNATRLNVLDLIETRVMDARKVSQELPEESFDKILVDAPCSGLGLMRRKPDIRYTKTMEDILSLQKVQLDILNGVTSALKTGGRLIYSTCTITRKENEEVVQEFLKQNKEFELERVFSHHDIPHSEEGFIELYPHYYGTDGFFIASLRKK